MRLTCDCCACTGLQQLARLSAKELMIAMMLQGGSSSSKFQLPVLVLQISDTAIQDLPKLVLEFVAVLQPTWIGETLYRWPCALSADFGLSTLKAR